MTVDYSRYDGYLAPDEPDPCRRCGWADGKLCESCAATHVGVSPRTVRRWWQDAKLPAEPGTAALLGYPLFPVAALVRCERDQRRARDEGTEAARTTYRRRAVTP
jgi:hypothetical protein